VGLDRALLQLDAHPLIEVRLFNPFPNRYFRFFDLVLDFHGSNRRMHNKAFIADNQRAVLGGRNIGDEYFEAHGDVAFGDLDVITLGPVVGEVSKAFDAYWNAPASVPIGALTGRRGVPESLGTLREELAAFVEAQRDSPYVKNARAALGRGLAAGSEGLYWGRAHLLVDDPAKVTRPPEDAEGHLLPQFGKFGVQLKSELLIVSPYFIPGDDGVAALRREVERGVRVTVLTNSLAATDVSAVHAGYKRYREALLEGGVRLYELKPGAIDYGRAKDKNRGVGSSRASLHAKTFVFDRRAVFIGSLNLDPRSVKLNTEIGVVCDSEPMAVELSNGLLGALDQIAWRLERIVQPDGTAQLAWIETTAAGTVRHLDEPGVSAWRKFGVWFLGLLPIESQL
jgi:putative cardiolipin synthase